MREATAAAAARTSPPVYQLVERMITQSDNDLAERRPGGVWSFRGASGGFRACENPA